MIKKPTPYVNNPGTTSDAVLREVSDLYGKSIRVSDAGSVVDRHFSHFRAEYDVNNNPTRVRYYHGTEARRTKLYLASAATLGGKYLKIYTAPDDQLITIWFNVDSLNSQPSVPNTFKYIEIPLLSTDDNYLVGLAIYSILNGLYSNYLYCIRDDGNHVEIITSQMGENTVSDSGTSGFVLSQIAGSQDLIQDIEITYQGNDPVYNGQVLKGYYFDIYSAKFSKNSATLYSGEVLNTVSKNKLFSKPFDKLEVLLKNDDGNPLEVQSYLDSDPVQLVTISYDLDGDFLSAEVTDF